MSAALLLVLGGAGSGCKPRNATGELIPPRDAEPWSASLRQAFDDDFTPEPINLQGRAPHDVRDQQLLAARLGLSSVIAQVQVKQVLGRGRYQGRQDQYVDIELEQVLLGELPKGTAERHMLMVKAEDELPGSLQDQSLLLFLRWDAEAEPPYHHHLMPVESEAMTYIGALIEHAKAEGVLDAEGVPVEQGGRRSRRSRRTDRAKD